MAGIISINRLSNGQRACRRYVDVEYPVNSKAGTGKCVGPVIIGIPNSSATVRAGQRSQILSVGTIVAGRWHELCNAKGPRAGAIRTRPGVDQDVILGSCGNCRRKVFGTGGTRNSSHTASRIQGASFIDRYLRISLTGIGDIEYHVRSRSQVKQRLIASKIQCGNRRTTGVTGSDDIATTGKCSAKRQRTDRGSAVAAGRCDLRHRQRTRAGAWWRRPSVDQDVVLCPSCKRCGDVLGTGGTGNAGYTGATTGRAAGINGNLCIGLSSISHIDRHISGRREGEQRLITSKVQGRNRATNGDITGSNVISSTGRRSGIRKRTDHGSVYTSRSIQLVRAQKSKG